MTELPCPHCKKPFDISSMTWTCPQCSHVDRDWNPTLNCGNCGFNPDDTTDMHCPLCNGAINIMGVFFNKSQSTTSMQERSAGNHVIRHFLTSNNVLISPEIQNAPHFPFTMECARTFFEVFLDERFQLDALVGSILINSAKENLPRHSFASGFLFSETLDELEKLTSFPSPVGSIHMEYGGNTITPVIKVAPM